MAVLEMRHFIVFARIDMPYVVEIESAIGRFFSFVTLFDFVAVPAFRSTFQVIEMMVIPHRSTFVRSYNTVTLFDITRAVATLHFRCVIYISDDSSGILIMSGRNGAFVIAIMHHPMGIIYCAA